MEEFKVEERGQDGRRGHLPRGCARGVGQVLAARICQKEANKTHPAKESTSLNTD